MKEKVNYPRPCDQCPDADTCYAICGDYRMWINFWWKTFKRLFKPKENRRQVRNDGYFYYAHPNEVKRYLEHSPCEGCPMNATCDLPCPAYLDWWDAKMEQLRKKVGL